MPPTQPMSSLPKDAHAARPAGYDRQRDLPRLLRLWPEEVRKLAGPDQGWLVKRLGQVLRAERQLALSRHWSYDLARHAALLRAWRAEKAILEQKPAVRTPTGAEARPRSMAAAASSA